MRSLIAIVAFVLAALAVAAAIVYFAVPAHSLPSVLPGHVAGVAGHRTKRGIAAAFIAVVLVIVGIAVVVSGRRPSTVQP